MTTIESRSTASRGVKGTWLEPFFGASSKIPLKVIADNMSCDTSTVKRLLKENKPLQEDGEKVKKIAIAVRAIGLGNQKNLPLDQLIDSLCVAQRDYIRQLDHEKAMGQEVDAGRLRKALQACKQAGLETLVEHWCERTDGDFESLGLTLAEHIQSGAVDRIQNIIDDPLETRIEEGMLISEQRLNWTQIKRLEELIGAIAVCCAVPCQVEHLDPGEGIKVFGVDRDWSIRLVIDAALGYPLTHVHPANHRPRVLERYAAELEGAESPCVEAQARQVLQQADDERFTDDTARRILTQLDNRSVSSQDTQMPEPEAADYERKMQRFGMDYNDAVFYAHNNSRDHRFLFTTGEFPGAIRERLHALGVTQLRIVESLQQQDLPPSLRVDHGKLSGWLTKCLTKIKETADQLAGEGSDLTQPFSINIYAREISSIGDKNTVNNRSPS